MPSMSVWAPVHGIMPLVLRALLCRIVPPAPPNLPMQSRQAAVMHRIKEITSRHAWGHRFVLPEEALAKAFAVVGDASRLRSMAMKLVLGERWVRGAVGDPAQPWCA